jgi:hypothetical protein
MRHCVFGVLTVSDRRLSELGSDNPAYAAYFSAGLVNPAVTLETDA